MSLAVRKGYQRMKEEGVKGSEKVGKKLDLFCAQFCPLHHVSLPFGHNFMSNHMKRGDPCFMGSGPSVFQRCSSSTAYTILTTSMILIC